MILYLTRTVNKHTKLQEQRLHIKGALHKPHLYHLTTIKHIIAIVAMTAKFPIQIYKH